MTKFEISNRNAAAISGDYSSPPCYLHQIDPAYSGPTEDAVQQGDVKRWRKAERERLVAARLNLSAEERGAFSHAIAKRLDEIIGDVRGKTISFYWPFRGEPDLRQWIERAIDCGATCALPVVERKAAPLTFRAWSPGEALERGVWNIPFPSAGRSVVPDVVVAPVVGFDGGCYRLGYGGGFFDRTLALLPKRFAIGVGYTAQEIPTIYPQQHDIPMNVVITESRLVERSP